MTLPRHGPFPIHNHHIEKLEIKMIKHPSPGKSSENVIPSVAISPGAELVLIPYWLLIAGKAKKLGQHSASILNYHVVADKDRRGLLIAVTKTKVAATSVVNGCPYAPSRRVWKNTSRAGGNPPTKRARSEVEFST
jgi:hypothetical protein